MEIQSMLLYKPAIENTEYRQAEEDNGTKITVMFLYCWHC